MLLDQVKYHNLGDIFCFHDVTVSDSINSEILHLFLKPILLFIK